MRGVGSDADSRIEQLQAKIDELLIVYNDKHPTVVKLRDQIEELQRRQKENQSIPAPVDRHLDLQPGRRPDLSSI